MKYLLVTVSCHRQIMYVSGRMSHIFIYIYIYIYSYYIVIVILLFISLGTADLVVLFYVIDSFDVFVLCKDDWIISTLIYAELEGVYCVQVHINKRLMIFYASWKQAVGSAGMESSSPETISSQIPSLCSLQHSPFPSLVCGWYGLINSLIYTHTVPLVYRLSFPNQWHPNSAKALWMEWKCAASQLFCAQC